MIDNIKKIALILPAILGACASVPNGPSQMAMPGTGKSFDQFRADDAYCRQFAEGQIGGTVNHAANNSLVGSAVAGTAIGAAVGAIAGGGRAAGVGAATGLLAGSVIGADEAQGAGYGAQRRYDQAYMQCMYADGDRVPVSGQFVVQPAVTYVPPAYPSPGGAYPPPPPAGPPPPPPPGY
ncbi:MAG TPA: YMGG-like glycine zipper-containing protein [Burkholderiales bacterium]|nr:YMGG-like glycine zipper-containing protein [Burkholderiales bacterium]